MKRILLFFLASFLFIAQIGAVDPQSKSESKKSLFSEKMALIGAAAGSTIAALSWLGRYILPEKQQNARRERNRIENELYPIRSQQTAYEEAFAWPVPTWNEKRYERKRADVPCIIESMVAADRITNRDGVYDGATARKIVDDVRGCIETDNADIILSNLIAHYGGTGTAEQIMNMPAMKQYRTILQNIRRLVADSDYQKKFFKFYHASFNICDYALPMSIAVAGLSAVAYGAIKLTQKRKQAVHQTQTTRG